MDEDHDYAVNVVSEDSDTDFEDPVVPLRMRILGVYVQNSINANNQQARTTQGNARSSADRLDRLVLLPNNTDHDYLSSTASSSSASSLVMNAVYDEDDDNQSNTSSLLTINSAPGTLETDNTNPQSSSSEDNVEVEVASSSNEDNQEIDDHHIGDGNESEVVVVENNNDVLTPPQPKKRKRLPTEKTMNTTPKINENLQESDDDGLTCPICLDVWEMSGEHRLASLNCGHLFGDSCIRRWLNESARQTGVRVCPQCKTKAHPKEIRYIYAKRLRVVDRSEEHRMREELGVERSRTLSLESELTTLKMTYTHVAHKLKRLEAESAHMKMLLQNGGTNSVYIGGDARKTLQTYRLSLERNVEISREPGSRVMIYADLQSSMIVSQKSSHGLFPGYGVRFIDTPTFKPSTFLHASGKLIRDISLSVDQQLLVITSMEVRAKLFDLRNRQPSATFTSVDKPLWSCSLDRNREYFLYLGTQHGSTCVYDVRFPEAILNEFKAEGDSSPVINVASIAASSQFPFGGFLVCKLTSLWFYEYSSSLRETTASRLNVDGPFTSMRFDVVQDTVLVTTRSRQGSPEERYILGKIEKIDGSVIFNISIIFYGSKFTNFMTRSSQVAVQSNTLIAAYLQDSKMLTLFDVKQKQRLQSLPVQDVVYDTCPIYIKDRIYLAALTDAKYRIYHLTTTT
uniref:RING-type domain-containing protein n=1 Tax=Glossina brevipalpis TaxID=37001 RepID=A0A1A9W4Z1_9MUSC